MKFPGLFYSVWYCIALRNVAVFALVQECDATGAS